MMTTVCSIGLSAGTQGGNGSTSASSLQCRQLVINCVELGVGAAMPFVSLISACLFSIWSIKFPKSWAKLQISRWRNSSCCQVVLFLNGGWRESSLCKTMVLAKLKFSKFTPANLIRWLLSLSCLHWQSLWSHQWHDINASCFTASTPQKYVFLRFGAPDFVVDQNFLCFWTRFLTTRIPMHGTAVAHPQAVSLGFRSFGDCEAFQRKSGAKSWNGKIFFSSRGRWNSVSVKIYQRWSENKDVE